MREVGSRAELEAAVAGARAAAVHFWASWCEASKQMDEVFAHLAVDFPHAAFLRVNASFLSPRPSLIAVDSVLFGPVADGWFCRGVSLGIGLDL